MAEYSRLARMNVVSNGTGFDVRLPFQPQRVEWYNVTAAGAGPDENVIVQGNWDAYMGQGTGDYLVYNVDGALIANTTTTGGVSSYAAGTLLGFGPRKQVVSATKADPALFTVTAHGYTSADVVMFQGLYQSPTTGMPQICGIPFEITVTGVDTFSINWNTTGSNYTVLSGSPTGAYVKKVLYPYLYEPGVDIIYEMVDGAADGFPGTTELAMTKNNNYKVGQTIAFRIPAVWGPVELNSLPNSDIPGSPKYYQVVAVSENLGFNSIFINQDFSLLTALNLNQPVNTVPGLTFPQVVAVGDVNTGGQAISPGSQLYPSPIINGYPTINGPAINGAFVNNTSQGVIFGPVVAGSDGDQFVIYAYLCDFSNP